MGVGSRIVNHLFATAGNRDGQAAGLEGVARLGVARLGVARLEEAVTEPAPAQRRRQQHDTIREALAQKALHGWIQNRNQTLHPLTLNFRALDAGQADLLLRSLAFAMTANGPLDAARLQRAATAIELANGSRQLAERLPELAATPQSAQALFAALQAANLAGHAYAITMAAIDQRDPTNRAFAAYLAARLAIPETVSRSIGRRYRN